MGIVEEDILDPALYRWGVQRLRAHGGMGVERAHDCIEQLRLEVRRIGELLFRIVRRLLMSAVSRNSSFAGG